ncbi:DUF7660 family protein [Dentiradicibacter hellwigii]|uniref:DUF7660 domain-containing protein n=1 Tax=Dentiradicibacter hellwigii TaxID=3149053 RepID=A0ABV4UEC9_9RHOO
MKNIRPEELADNVQSKADFLLFLDSLIQDFNINKAEWENKNINDYLLSIEIFTEYFENYYKNNSLPIPQVDAQAWRLFADILMAGKIYE